MELGTIIALTISALSVLISGATLLHRKITSSNDDAKSLVLKRDFNDLERKVNRLDIDCNVVTERLANTIIQTTVISNKLDKLLVEVNKDDN